MLKRHYNTQAFGTSHCTIRRTFSRLAFQKSESQVSIDLELSHLLLSTTSSVHAHLDKLDIQRERDRHEVRWRNQEANNERDGRPSAIMTAMAHSKRFSLWGVLLITQRSAGTISRLDACNRYVSALCVLTEFSVTSHRWIYSRAARTNSSRKNTKLWGNISHKTRVEDGKKKCRHIHMNGWTARGTVSWAAQPLGSPGRERGSRAAAQETRWGRNSVKYLYVQVNFSKKYCSKNGYVNTYVIVSKVCMASLHCITPSKLVWNEHTRTQKKKLEKEH